MSVDTEFRDFVLDQLASMEPFETKNMFGGTALLSGGVAFAKIKHGSLWMKVDDVNINDFVSEGMPQYTYGKDNSRKLNFFETPVHVLEDSGLLVHWVKKAREAALRSKQG